MGIQYTYTGPDFRGLPGVIKEAQDEAFRHHQKKYLPEHFTESAPRRYRGSYQKRGKEAMKGGEAWAQRWARMSNEEKRKVAAELAKRRSMGKAHKKKKIPLVVSGILRRAITKGHLKGVGPAKRRRAVIPAPHYLNFHRPGQIHKRSAIGAILPSENRDFVATVDRYVERALRKIKKKTRM